MKIVPSLLIIDDSRSDVELTRIHLEESGRFPVIVSARDGVEALEFLAAAAICPALILLDINMPRMDGFEFIETYERTCDAGAPAPIVMLMSPHASKHRERALSYASVRATLEKPPSVADANWLADTFGVDPGPE